MSPSYIPSDSLHRESIDIHRVIQFPTILKSHTQNVRNKKINTPLICYILDNKRLCEINRSVRKNLLGCRFHNIVHQKHVLANSFLN